MATNTFIERIKIMLQGARKAAADGKKVESSLKKIQKAALAAGGSFFAAQGLINGFKHIVNLSLETEKVAQGFQALGANFNIARLDLNKLRQAVNGTVSDLDLMTEANNALTLGVADNVDQLAELFDSAQRVGKVLGLDTTQAVNSLVTGMGRQSKLMLDNLGIIVNVEDAYERFAEDMNIVGRELDDNEKKLAFNNETMRQLKETVALLGDESLTTSEHLTALATSTEGFAATQWTYIQNIVGRTLQNIGIAAEEGEIGMTSYTEAFNALVNVQDLEQFSRELQAGLSMMPEVLERAKVDLEEISEMMQRAAYPESSDDFANQLRVYDKIFTGLIGQLKEFGGINLDEATFLGVFANEYERIIALEDKRAPVLDKINEKKREAALPVYTVALQKEIDIYIPYLNAQERDAANKENLNRLNKEEADLIKQKEKALQRQIDMSIAAGVTETNTAKAVQVASAAYISDYIKKIIANYIFEAFNETGFFGGLGAVATGAAFGSLVGKTINSVAAAEGFNGIVTEPTMFLAGEAGAEYVDIDPLTNEGSNRGQGINITFTGNVMSQDFIESEAIPMIKKAIRKGGDIGIG